MVGFLAGTGVESRGGELTEFVEHCLGGGFIRDGGADVILFEEVAKAGKVARARERGESFGRLAAEKCFRGSGGAQGMTGISVNDAGTKFLDEGGVVVKEVERTVIVGVSGGGGGGDDGSHGSRDAWSGSCRGCSCGGVGRVFRVVSGKTARSDGRGRGGMAAGGLG